MQFIELFLVADLVAGEIAKGILAIVVDAIDEIGGGRLEAVGAEWHVFLLKLTSSDQTVGSVEVDVRTVDLLGHIVIPLGWLFFGDLAPATHLGQEPYTIGVPWVGGVILEEDVKVWHGTNVGLLEDEGTGHGVGDNVVVSTNVVWLAEDTNSFFTVNQLAAVVGGVEPLASADQSLGTATRVSGLASAHSAVTPNTFSGLFFQMS